MEVSIRIDRHTTMGTGGSSNTGQMGYELFNRQSTPVLRYGVQQRSGKVEGLRGCNGRDRSLRDTVGRGQLEMISLGKLG